MFWFFFSFSYQALLTRVAKMGEGAVELLRCGLVAQLIECQVFDMIPDSDAHRYCCSRGASGGRKSQREQSLESQ